MNYLIIALGGGIGSALRYAVSKFVQDNMSGAFSTFCNENIALLRGDNAFVALLYIASSMFCGLLAVALGYLIIDIIASGR